MLLNVKIDLFLTLVVWRGMFPAQVQLSAACFNQHMLLLMNFAYAKKISDATFRETYSFPLN